MGKDLGITMENDNVLIKHEKIARSTTASGLVVAELKVFGEVLEGDVVAVGNGTDYNMTVKPGDKVYFVHKDIKTKTIFEGKDYYVLTEKELLAYKRESE